jgi:hypothetical protein
VQAQPTECFPPLWTPPKRRRWQPAASAFGKFAAVLMLVAAGALGMIVSITSVVALLDRMRVDAPNFVPLPVLVKPLVLAGAYVGGCLLAVLAQHLARALRRFDTRGEALQEMGEGNGRSTLG